MEDKYINNDSNTKQEKRKEKFQNYLKECEYRWFIANLIYMPYYAKQKAYQFTYNLSTNSNSTQKLFRFYNLFYKRIKIHPTEKGISNTIQCCYNQTHMYCFKSILEIGEKETLRGAWNWKVINGFLVLYSCDLCMWVCVCECVTLKHYTCN